VSDQFRHRPDSHRGWTSLAAYLARLLELMTRWNMAPAAFRGLFESLASFRWQLGQQVLDQLRLLGC